MTLDLDKLERTARAARPGPWQWYGNTNTREVYLATAHSGRVFVMDFVRWGMHDAQPRFQVEPGVMVALGELGKQEHPMGPMFEATYRRQFTGIGHPDAQHIAANSPDVTLALIARIRELEASLGELVAECEERTENPGGDFYAEPRAVLEKGAVLP